MPPLVCSAEVALDAERIAGIRDGIAAWARRTPHHDHADLADRIEITGVRFEPCYSVRLTSQIDQRTVEVKREPYRDQAIPPRRYRYPGEVDRWAEPGHPHDGFEEHWGSFVVEGSQNVERCGTCGGDGRMRCPTCGGKRRFTCPSCGGTPTRTCSACGGRRTETRSCSNCSGGTYYNHSVNQRVTCSHCGGTGKSTVSCTSCGGTGQRTCSTCRGKGVVVCSRCGGKGTVTCPTCEGRGRVLTWFELEQTLEVSPQGRTCTSARVAEDYPTLTIDPHTEGGELQLDRTDAQIATDQLADVEVVIDEIRDQLARAAARRDETTRVSLQNLQVVQWDLYLVDYRYEGEDHRLVLHEPDGRVLDDNGPIHAAMMAHLEQAQELADRRPSKALKAVSRAAAMDPHRYFPEIYELRDELLTRVMGHYEYGVWPALLALAALFYYARLEWFREPLVYLPWLRDQLARFDGAATVHLHTTCVLFVVLVLGIAGPRAVEVLGRSLGANLSLFLLRVSSGLVVASAYGVVALGAILLLEYSGLTMIVDVPVYLVVEAGSWLYGLLFGGGGS